MKGAWSKIDRTEFVMTEDTNACFLLFVGEYWTHIDTLVSMNLTEIGDFLLLIYTAFIVLCFSFMYMFRIVVLTTHPYL